MPRPSPITEEQELEVVRLYGEGRGRNELATLFGSSRQVITDRLKKHGIRVRSSPEVCRADLRHNAFADAENDQEAAYWAGFLMADGCISEHSKSTTYIVIVLGEEDRHHLQRFLGFLGAKNAVREVRPRGQQINTCYRVDVASRSMAADLARYGVVPRKTETAAVEQLEGSPDFWRGVVDGDGSIGFRNRPGSRPSPVLQICGSLPLMRQFAAFAASQVKTRSQPHRSKSIWGIAYHCGVALDLLGVLYPAGRTSLPRKYAIARKVMAEYQPNRRVGVRASDSGYLLSSGGAMTKSSLSRVSR